MSRQALTDVILTVRFDVICSGWAHDVILTVRIYVIITTTVTICVLGHLLDMWRHPWCPCEFRLAGIGHKLGTSSVLHYSHVCTVVFLNTISFACCKPIIQACTRGHGFFTSKLKKKIFGFIHFEDLSAIIIMSVRILFQSLHRYDNEWACNDVTVCLMCMASSSVHQYVASITSPKTFILQLYFLFQTIRAQNVVHAFFNLSLS